METGDRGFTPRGIFAALRRGFLRLDPSWRWGAGAFLAGRLGLTLVGWVLWSIGWIPPGAGQEYYFGVPPITGGVGSVLLGLAQRWDAIHYVRIASSGYSVPELTAFFPLYPLAGGALGRLMGGHMLAGLLLVSNASMLGALVLLYRIVAHDIDTSVAGRAVISAVVFPTSFFLYAAYPQSLVLLLALLAYWAAVHRRWLWVAVAGMATGLTHATGLPLALLLGWLALKERRRHGWLGWLARLAASATPLLGTALFLAWRIHAGLPGFTELVYSNWGRTVTWPWINLIHVFRLSVSPYLPLMGWFNPVAWALSAGAAVWAIRKLPGPLALYLGASVLLMMANTTLLEPLSGYDRYILAAFPLFMALGEWLSGRLGKIALAVGVAVQLYAYALFVAWIWVA